DLLRDRNNGAVAYMDVAADEVGNGRIHGEHGCAANDELAARGQGRTRRSGLARGQLREQWPWRQRRRSHRGGPQKAAPAQSGVSHAFAPSSRAINWVYSEVLSLLSLRPRMTTMRDYRAPWWPPGGHKRDDT